MRFYVIQLVEGIPDIITVADDPTQAIDDLIAAIGESTATEFTIEARLDHES